MGAGDDRGREQSDVAAQTAGEGGEEQMVEYQADGARCGYECG